MQLLYRLQLHTGLLSHESGLSESPKYPLVSLESRIVAPRLQSGAIQIVLQPHHERCEARHHPDQ
jgi:hypothetical protein